MPESRRVVDDVLRCLWEIHREQFEIALDQNTAPDDECWDQIVTAQQLMYLVQTRTSNGAYMPTQADKPTQPILEPDADEPDRPRVEPDPRVKPTIPPPTPQPPPHKPEDPTRPPRSAA